MKLEYAIVASPIGPLLVVVGERGVCLLDLDGDRDRARRQLERRFGDVVLVKRGDPAGVVSRLRAYVKGDLQALDDIPVDLDGTAFQQRVWRALRRVPPGKTASYGEIARRIGAPAAVRAVGAANGANPVPLIVPCHRVIGSSGRLTGYGGGLDRKEWLLRHEGASYRTEMRQGGLPYAD
jgi:methylated-DNA-[protein]-cysteine S-methyltransferase